MSRRRNALVGFGATSGDGGVTSVTSTPPEGVTMTVYAQPGTDGSVVTYKSRYENWIGGEWVAPVKGQYFENPSPVNGKIVLRGRARHGRGHRARARRRPRRRPGLGQDVGGRARHHPQQDRRPHRAEPRDARRRRDLGQRQARPRDAWPPTCRWSSTTSATSPARSGPRRATSRSSTTTPSPTTSTSRWASSARSSRGTSRCSWRPGSSHRRWPPATPSCSSRPSRRRRRSCC